MVHFLGDREYGLWVLAGTLVGYSTYMDLGLRASVNRHVAVAIGVNDTDECNRIFNTSVMLYSVLGLVALLLTAVIASLSPMIFGSHDYAKLFGKVILILGLNTALGFPMRSFGGLLAAQLRYDINAAIRFISLILRTTCIVWVLSIGYKILALAWVSFLSGIPGKILKVYFTKKNVSFLRFSRKDCNRETAKTLIEFGAFTFIARLAHLLKFRVDIVVISAFLGLTAVTHYRIASMMVQNYITLIFACTGMLLPVFSRQYGTKDDEGIKKTFLFGTRISMHLASFVGFGLIVWGKPFIQRWMGPEYLDAFPCLVVLTLGQIFALWQSPSFGLLLATSRQKFLAAINSIEGICNLALSLLLVKPYGILGVALGTFFPAVIFKVAVQPIFVCRFSSIRYREFILTVARTGTIVCLALAVPLFISLRFRSPDYHSLAILGCVSFVSYFLIIWFCELSSTERKLLYNAVFPGFSVKRT